MRKKGDRNLFLFTYPFVSLIHFISTDQIYLQIETTLMHRIEIESEQRILILDGAMGTMIQPLKLREEDFRNPALKNHPIELKGNTDLLNLTRPDVIKQIHLDYLHAGADIISTNTFGANRISQADYDLTDLVYEINFQGAKLARDAIREYTQGRQIDKPLFVAGAIGPTTKLASLSPDVNNPGFRAINFDQLVEAYTEQANALIEGGVDLFLLETVTDTLNVKAALFALMTISDNLKKRFPIMVSGTITDASGRILSGQTVEAFLISISHAPLLSVGLNCALGAKELRPYIEVLHKNCSFLVSTHPNAGLPNQFGSYDQSAEEFANLVSEFAARGWVNIVGGCCGTTPLHIKAAAEKLKHLKPRNTTVRYATSTKETDPELVKQIRNWEPGNSSSHFELKELIRMISGVEDEIMFHELKSKITQAKRLYHPEQFLLLNAHLQGRYHYLKSEGKLQKRVA